MIAEMLAAIPIPDPIKKEPEPMPEPTPIRTTPDLANASIEKMGRGDRQRIFAAIMDNWDASKARYIGAVGDQSIATNLNIARAWVEHIRAENFGDAGDNEEIEGLREELLVVQRKLAADSDDALKIAAKIDGYHKQVAGLLQRLEKVEKATGARR